MKTTMIITAITLLCSISGAALAKSNGVPPNPGGIAGSDPAKIVTGLVPGAEPSPSTMPGGLYRLGNGYVNCPDTVPVTNGQPKLRSCTYVKDLH